MKQCVLIFFLIAGTWQIASGQANLEHVAGAQALAAPPPAPPTPGEAMQRAGGSLLRAAVSMPADSHQARLPDVSFFAVPDPQPKTLKKHDLITVIVREETEFKSEGTTDLKRNTDIEAKIEEWIKLQIRNVAIQGGAQGPNPPGVKVTGQRNFKGEATVDRSDSLTLRVTGEIIDVRPNGTLFVQAKQKIKHDEEEQDFILSGVVRVEDVTPDNTVLSTQMYDKQLTTTHKGAVRDTTNRGVVTKLLDFLNPF